MQSVTPLLALLAAASAAVVTPVAEGPYFCNDLDCPKFTVTKWTKDYELRQYDETYWVSVLVQSSGMWEDRSASSLGFNKLFKYISGANEKGLKMPMTAPVLTTHANNSVVMHFMIPLDVADSAPKPTDSSVFLTALPAQELYVRAFGGFAHGFFNDRNFYQPELEALKNALNKNGASYDKSQFLTAGYDGPMKLFSRHNEVAVMKV